MAKIQEEIVVVRLSKLVRNGDPVAPLTDEAFVGNLESILGELLGETVVIEVEKEQL